MVIGSSKIIHGFYSNTAQPERLGSRTDGLLATLPVGITKTLIVHLEEGGYPRNVDRFAHSQRESGIYFCKNPVRCSRPGQRNAELSGFTYREVCVCRKEVSRWESAEECVCWINIRMLRSSEAGRKGHMNHPFILQIIISRRNQWEWVAMKVSVAIQ